jgi:hypothetical protein
LIRLSKEVYVDSTRHLLLERCIRSLCWFSEYADAIVPGVGFLL